jgi:hypothetical protein
MGLSFFDAFAMQRGRGALCPAPKSQYGGRSQWDGSHTAGSDIGIVA